MEKKPLIILTGPTAVGKSELSIQLAKAVNGEIISADSMQVYKMMDIGSAKITQEEMQGVPHYLIDELMPDEEFNVVRFQSMAKSYMSEIYNRGHIPILVGGTGFYIQSVLYDIDFTKERSNSEIRDRLQQLANASGEQVLFERLKEIDPESAKVIHPNNIKRVIRAIEFYEQTGSKISEHNETERKKHSPYNFSYFVLNDERDRLYKKIDQRVDQMVELGLIEEVQRLKDSGYHKDMVSMQGLGYKEILDYLNNDCSLEDAIYIIKRDTRHFAKRQITWFKRESDVSWVNKPDYSYDNNKILQSMLQILQNKNIIKGN